MLAPITQVTIPCTNHEGRTRNLHVETWAEPDGSAPELRIRIANPDSDEYEEVPVPADAVVTVYEAVGAALPSV